MAPPRAPLLLVLNGPPAVGKSTLAERYSADHPLSLRLDLDVLRNLLGSWHESPDEAGRLARAMGLAMARAALGDGHDVVVPQYLSPTKGAAFLDALVALAAEVGARHVEVLLLDDRDRLVERFRNRSAVGATAEHRDASRHVAAAGGLGKLHAMYDELLALPAERPGTVVVQTVTDEVEATYGRLLRALAATG